MAQTSGDGEPVARKIHQLDQYAVKGVNKAENMQSKIPTRKGDQEKEKEKGPAGGFDDTPIPQRQPGYTIKFTFHRATALPFADVNTLSSDPYVLAELRTDLPARHKQDPPIQHRTRTIRRNVDPEWNEEWIVANVPASGFRLKCRLFDEDPADHDDRLGNVHVDVESIRDGWDGIKEGEYKIRKSSGSKRAYFMRGCAAMFNRNVHMSGTLIVSVELLGPTRAHDGGRVFTVGPCSWTRHLSPMIGRLAGVKDPNPENKDGDKTEKYNFQANQMQLQGPVPAEMYHRYVEFKPFVKGMFTGLGLRGRLLNRALHHQHARVYNFDRSTEYGSFAEPSTDTTKKFLDLIHFDEGGRIFTYVLSLDGLWRFTETGKEFGIDLLSKHTMHSDVSIYIAYSGEFFVRRLKNPYKKAGQTKTHPPEDIEGGPPEQDSPRDPAYYQLFIDNDSGTYRPNKDLLPQLKKFLSRSLPGLKITTLDCQGDQQKMNKLKEEQQERKKAEGDGRVFAQAGDDSSISSSDESDLDDVAIANGETKMSKREKIHNQMTEGLDKSHRSSPGHDRHEVDEKQEADS